MEFRIIKHKHFTSSNVRAMNSWHVTQLCEIGDRTSQTEQSRGKNCVKKLCTHTEIPRTIDEHSIFHRQNCICIKRDTCLSKSIENFFIKKNFKIQKTVHYMETWFLLAFSFHIFSKFKEFIIEFVHSGNFSGLYKIRSIATVTPPRLRKFDNVNYKWKPAESSVLSCTINYMVCFDFMESRIDHSHSLLFCHSSRHFSFHLWCRAPSNATR